jgi:hypothetical protein
MILKSQLFDSYSQFFQLFGFSFFLIFEANSLLAITNSSARFSFFPDFGRLILYWQ